MALKIFLFIVALNTFCISVISAKICSTIYLFKITNICFVLFRSLSLPPSICPLSITFSRPSILMCPSRLNCLYWMVRINLLSAPIFYKNPFLYLNSLLSFWSATLALSMPLRVYDSHLRLCSGAWKGEQQRQMLVYVNAVDVNSVTATANLNLSVKNVIHYG